MELTKKIIILGNVGVGKTSMVNRFVFDRFSETYYSTIGVRIEKKVVTVGDDKLNFIIWDIAGESNQQNTPQSYFLGTSAIIYLVDISAPPSYLNVETDIQFIKSKIPNSPLLLVANKFDLLNETQVQHAVKMMPIKPDMLISAKSNLNVESVFKQLANLILLEY